MKTMIKGLCLALALAAFAGPVAAADGKIDIATDATFPPFESIDANGKDAEFAILVSHYVNGMGLGRHLMRRLVRWAKGRKVQRVYGDVLESNLPMQALATSLGFRQEPTGEPGLVRVVLDIPPPKPKIAPPPMPLPAG